MVVALWQCLSTGMVRFWMTSCPCSTADQPCDEVMNQFCGTSSRCSRRWTHALQFALTTDWRVT